MLLALSLPLPGYFRWSIAILTVLAFASSTHDIAADGLYIAQPLVRKSRPRTSAGRAPSTTSPASSRMGALVWLVGALSDHFAASGRATPDDDRLDGRLRRPRRAARCSLGALPHPHAAAGRRRTPHGSLRQAARTFGDVVVTFFQKPSIWLLLVFIFLFRAGEGR